MPAKKKKEVVVETAPVVEKVIVPTSTVEPEPRPEPPKTPRQKSWW